MVAHMNSSERAGAITARCQHVQRCWQVNGMAFRQFPFGYWHTLSPFIPIRRLPEKSWQFVSEQRVATPKGESNSASANGAHWARPVFERDR